MLLFYDDSVSRCGHLFSSTRSGGKHFQILHQIREAWQEGSAHSADMLWAVVRQEEITSFRSLKKKRLLAREFFTSQSEFRQWSPRLSSNQFIQTDACLHLKYTSTNGRKPAIGLAARWLITIPEVFFLFCFSFFSHSITWRSFQIRQPQLLVLHSDLMWNLTKCWRRLKESLWFPLVEQEVSFLPPPVWSHLCMSLCVVTPPPFTPAKTPRAQIREKSFIYL